MTAAASLSKLSLSANATVADKLRSLRSPSTVYKPTVPPAPKPPANKK